MVFVSKAVLPLSGDIVNEEVTVIIPVWNRADLLQKLLDTIATQDMPPSEVIVVDNGSTDNAPAVAARWGARVLAMGRNAGFAAAVNYGIGEARTDWVAVLNSDVELEPGWLGKIVCTAINSKSWFATGKIFSASDHSRLDGTWDLIAKSGCAWRAGNGSWDSAPFSERRSIAMAPATAVLYRRALFERIGTFADVYESYMEDVDLSLRCAAAGLAGVYEPGARCRHRGSASSAPWDRRVCYLISRNQELLIRRLYPPELRRQWRWKIRIGQLLWGLVAMRHGRLVPWLRGKWDARGAAARVVLDGSRLRDTITDSEREIRTLQTPSSNWYWRLYFLFTAGESG